MLKAFLVSLSPLLLVCCAAAEPEPHDFHVFEKTIREELGPHGPAGFAYAILDHGKVVASGAEGYCRGVREKPDGGIRWTLDKPQGLASISKLITALSVLHLWDEKEHSFSLDDPFWPHIRRVVPDCGEDARKITIRQLLTHKSGLARIDAIGDATTPGKLEKLLKEPLAFKPGEHFNYDNNNFYILHILIEELSHYSYTGYVKRHVLKSLGIDTMDTHFEHDRPTCGYMDPTDKRLGFPFDWECTPWAGAAGWYGSVDDLIRLLQGMRQHTILSEEAEKIMYSELMGFDRGARNMPYGKGGDWYWEVGDGPSGSVHSAVIHGPDDVDAVLLMNWKFQKHPLDILVDAWLKSRPKPKK